jgi:hypothetical protein
VDRREFEIMQRTGQKQRFLGKNLSKDWNTATQYSITVEKSTWASMLSYSEIRNENCEKLVAFCLVRGTDYHRVPSFQQDGIGFGSFKPFEVELEPKFVYTLVTYCTDDSVKGNFGICIFTKKGSPKLNVKEAVEWKCSVQEKGEWKDDTAGGSAEYKLNNQKFLLTNKDKKTAKVLVMLRQINKTFDALMFADGGHRITPSKFYVGFYVYNEDVTKILTQTEKWTNSYDVNMFVDLDPGQSVVVIPTTEKEEQEMAYEVHAYSDSKLTLSRKQK